MISFEIISHIKFSFSPSPSVSAALTEKMHSVVDSSSHSLPLGNGERLRIPSLLRFVFETASLTSSSPSFVSRCGVVHIASDSLQWKPIVLTFFSSVLLDLDFAADVIDSLVHEIEKIITQGFGFLNNTRGSSSYGLQRSHVDDDQHDTCSHHPIAIINSLIAIFSSFLPDYHHHLISSSSSHEPHSAQSMAPRTASSSRSQHHPTVAVDADHPAKHLGVSPRHELKRRSVFLRLVIFAHVWAFRSCFLRRSHCDEFDLLTCGACPELFLHTPDVTSRGLSEVYVDLKTGEFVYWESSLALEKSATWDLQGWFVRTSSVKSLQWIASKLLLSGRSVLLLGLTGSGKTSLSKSIMADMSTLDKSSSGAVMNLSCLSDGDRMRHFLSTAQSVKSLSSFSPSVLPSSSSPNVDVKQSKSRIVLFLDDLHLSSSKVRDA
jgi:hypothetical protein